MVGPPLAEALLGVMTWEQVFIVFAALILATLLLLPLIKGPRARRPRLRTSPWDRSSPARYAIRASS